MSKQVKVFTTPTCPYCSMAKQYLRMNNVEFENIDLSKQPKWINRMIAKSGQMGVPQLWIDDEVIVGFNVPAIKQALSI